MALPAAEMRREERSHELGTFLSRLFFSGICSEPDLFCRWRGAPASADQASFSFRRTWCSQTWRPYRLGRRLDLQHFFADGLSRLVLLHGLSAHRLEQRGCVAGISPSFAYDPVRCPHGCPFTV